MPDETKTIEPPFFISGRAFWMVKNTPRALMLNVLSKYAGVAKSMEACSTKPGAGHDDIDASLFGRNGRKQPVEVSEVRDVALNGRHVSADRRLRLVALDLVAASLRPWSAARREANQANQKGPGGRWR
jgi:hypothetical protein